MRGIRLSALIDINVYPINELLPILLIDRTTKKNIIWATDAYEELGPGYEDKNIIESKLLQGKFTLQPRISKSLEEQQQRTRKKAEVMTPVWICNKMNNYVDEQWFGRKDVFNHEKEDNSWIVTEGNIDFGKMLWRKYIDSRRMEITCGEAPYLVSRYDTTTGEMIVPLARRIGILDRKLRIVNENAEEEKDWIRWAKHAFESCYGYEYQGDNLLIARINLLLTFMEYYMERWDKEPELNLLSEIAQIISWNIWQMDGLKDTVPLGKPYEENHQVTMFEWMGVTAKEPEAVPCKIKNWRTKETIYFKDLKGIREYE